MSQPTDKEVVAIPSQSFRIALEISETEARLLDGILGYGGKNLLEAVRKHLGQHYVERITNEEAEHFSNRMRPALARALGKCKTARELFHNETTR